MRAVSRAEVEKLDRRAALIFHAIHHDRWTSNHEIIRDLHGQCNVSVAQVDHYGKELCAQGFCRKRDIGGRLHYMRAEIAPETPPKPRLVVPAEAMDLARFEPKEVSVQKDDSPEALMEQASKLLKELEEVHNRMLNLISSLQKRPIVSEEELAVLVEKAGRFDQFVALTQPIK